MRTNTPSEPNWESMKTWNPNALVEEIQKLRKDWDKACELHEQYLAEIERLTNYGGNLLRQLDEANAKIKKLSELIVEQEVEYRGKKR